jgi:uncharacterized protein
MSAGVTNGIGTGGRADADALRDQRDFAAALLDPARPVPDGWVGHNGADPARRFAVYRNNVVVSLMAALADTFPVVRRVLGAEAFDALARWHVVVHPPRSAVLTDWGDDLPQALAAASALAPDARPWLADLARLERARVRACHAADAAPVARERIERALADPARLPQARLGLHPSLQVVTSTHAVVSLWAAHQRDDDERAPAAVDLRRPESAVVLRDLDDEVLVLPVPAAAAALLSVLAQGLALGAATAHAAGVAAADGPPFDAAPVLALLIRHGALCAWHDDGDPPCEN